jgi:hypothetical protein
VSKWCAIGFNLYNKLQCKKQQSSKGWRKYSRHDRIQTKEPHFVGKEKFLIKCLKNDDPIAKGTNIAHAIAAQVPYTIQRVQ